MWPMFLLGFFGGLSATPHCLGMCGGFPLHLAKSSARGSALLRQILFVTGKAFTYVFLGAIAGAIGTVLMQDTVAREAVPAIRIAAGCLVVVFGCSMLGMPLPFLASGRSKKMNAKIDMNPVMGLFQRILDGILANPAPSSALGLGLCAGFLPCPLPIGMLILAAASRNVVAGMMIMAGVGLGTTPGLLGLGIFGAGLFNGSNRKLAKIGLRAAGAIVLAVGMLTIGRATGLIHSSAPLNHVIPPCCEGLHH